LAKRKGSLVIITIFSSEKSFYSPLTSITAVCIHPCMCVSVYAGWLFFSLLEATSFSNCKGLLMADRGLRYQGSLSASLGHEVLIAIVMS
jgi:hypothetical protein